MLLPPTRSFKKGRHRVVGAAREELEREEWMSRSSFAEVELYRERAPDVGLVAGDDEINGKAAEHTFAREPCTHLGRFDTNRPCISGIGRETSAVNHLSVSSAEELSMP